MRLVIDNTAPMDDATTRNVLRMHTYLQRRSELDTVTNNCRRVLLKTLHDLSADTERTVEALHRLDLALRSNRSVCDALHHALGGDLNPNDIV